MEKEQLDRKSSYVSLSRKSSNISATNSSLTFMEHSSPSVLELPKKKDRDRDRDRDRNSIMSDGEADLEEYQKDPKAEAIGSKLKEELCKYKQELKEYNETTKELEEKYMKINYELSEMQQKHDQFVATRNHPNSEVDMESEPDPEDPFYNSASSVTSQMTIRRKSPEIMQSNTSFMTVLSAHSSYDDLSRKKYSSSSSGRKNNVFNSRIVETLANRHAKRRNRSLEQQDEVLEPSAFKDVYHVLKDVINTPQVGILI